MSAVRFQAAPDPRRSLRARRTVAAATVLLSRTVLAATALLCGTVFAAAESRPRARDLGIAPGIHPPGRLNAITDVEGVRVGHTTVIEGDDVRTGVTAVLPHGGNLFQEKVAGAVFVGNAFGKLAGSTQVSELGTIETPMVLTNTLSVGVAVDAVVRYTLGRPGNEQVRSVNALVGETNDGGLNDIRGFHVTRQHVLDAIANASGGPVAEGSVGAGTGTIAFGWKGGIGTSSRSVPGGWVIGVLAQTNFGGNLTIAGAPIFRLLQPGKTVGSLRNADPAGASGDGSCMLVVATDAPLDARDLGRLAARAIFGLARTGSSYSNGSGDFAIAFSTSPEMRSRHGETGVRARSVLTIDALSPLFEGALEATEEAVYNSLFQATTVTSRLGTAEAIPAERVRDLLKR
jgi:D-aminopeptidase